MPSEVQRCPAVPKPENSAPSTARSRSALGVTTSGFLPPSSRQAVCRCRPVSAPISAADRRGPGEPDLVDQPLLQRRRQPGERRLAVGVHHVEHAVGQPAAAHEQLVERRPSAAEYSAGFQTTVLPASRAGTMYQDGTATGKLPGGDHRDRAHRLAEGEQLLVRHLAGHGLAVEPPALAEEEVAGVDDLPDLAERLGVRLADLAGDQAGQRLGVVLDQPADGGDRPAAHRRRHRGPLRLRLAGRRRRPHEGRGVRRVSTSATTSSRSAGLVLRTSPPAGHRAPDDAPS